MLIQVINLNVSKKRRERYEQEFKKNNLKFSRLEASNGISDLKIIELDKNKKKSEVDIKKLKNKEIDLKVNTKYLVFDKNYPELKYKYWLAPNKMIIKKKKRQRHLTVGEFGCMLSHLRAINNIAFSKKNIKYGLILEDDFVLDNNFKKKCNCVLQKAPKNFGLLKLDGTSVRDCFRNNNHKTSFLFSIIKYGFNRYFYNSQSEVFHGVSGATGYVITKKCAQKIIKLLKKETINGLEGAVDILYYITLPKKYNFKDIWIIKKPLIWQNGEESYITKFGR